LVGLAGIEKCLNTACNIMSAMYKKVGRWDRVGRVEEVGGQSGWVNIASRQR